MPTVSVILPSYNHKDYVSTAIESVLSQSYTDYELLISDDRSTDGTDKVIQGYVDSRIKADFLSENIGAAPNHKRLIDKCQGKYVALINSDDVWLPGKLKKQVDYMEQHPECGACFSYTQIIDENGCLFHDATEMLFMQKNRTQAEWLYRFYTKGNCICHPSLLIRRELYQEMGCYSFGLRQLPDFLMWINIVKKYPIHIIQEALVQHRRFINRGENTSSPHLRNSMRDVMESYYILSERFFKNMSDQLFIEAFSCLFKNREARNAQQLACERYFLLLSDKWYLPKISLQAAIIYYMNIIDDAAIQHIFLDEYHYSPTDFFSESCKVDLLNLADTYQIDEYIRQNKAHVLAEVVFSDKNSILYRSFRKIYKGLK